jgi:hypothetical protein
MTPTNTTGTTGGVVTVADIADIIDDAARLLGLVEDWLLHTDDTVHDELAYFLSPTAGRARVRALINVIGQTALSLTRLLPGGTS